MKAVLFDLDGTLLPMDMQVFLKAYMEALARKGAALGYNPTELVQVVLAGVEAMVQNDGTMTNEERFWQLFLARCGGERARHVQFFEEFYSREFCELRQHFAPTPLARQAVQIVKEKGYAAVLATNPLFPRMATLERLAWAGLDAADFILITTFEDCRFTKPNLGYYGQILDALGAAPQDCLMVGNDVVEDLAAVQLGMESFLVTDDLVNPQGVDYTLYRHGTRNDLIAYLTSLPDRK